MSEVCLLPRPSYSRGRACKAQSQHKHFMKNRFSTSVCNTVANIPGARAKGFSQRTAVRLTLHFIYQTYIIHISYVLYITYIFYTIFCTIFSRSTSTSTPSSSSSSSSSSPTSVSPTLSTPPTHFFHQPHLFCANDLAGRSLVGVQVEVDHLQVNTCVNDMFQVL